MILAPEEAKDLEAVLAQFSVEIYARRQPISFKLAYPIKKQVNAYFGVFNFYALPGDAQKIRDALRGKKYLLRSLLVLSLPRIVPYIPRNEASSRPTEVVEKPKVSTRPEVLSNEALEEKLEEILK